MSTSRNTAPAPDAPAIETWEPASPSASVDKWNDPAALARRLGELATLAENPTAELCARRLAEAFRPDDLPLVFVSAASLRGKRIELPPVIIDGLLRRKEVMIFAGESKVGKTWLALKMAHAVASGTDWMGQPTHAGPVLYLNFEINGDACDLRTQTICEQSDEWPEGLLLAHLRGKRADVAGMAGRLAKAAKERGAVFIIIDALYNALGDRDENSNADMAALINECVALSEEADAAVALIHHFNKGAHRAGGGDESPAANSMSGAGALMRAPDAIVTVLRLDAERVERYGLSDEEMNLLVSASLRTQKDLEPFVIARAHGAPDFRRVAVNVRGANAEAAKVRRGGRKKKGSSHFSVGAGARVA